MKSTAVNSGPGINYAEVIGDLRIRAAQLVEAASILEEQMGREQPAVSVAPVERAAKPVQVKSVAAKKRQAQVRKQDARPNISQASAAAPSNRDVVRQVLAQRIDRTRAEVADHAIALRPALRRTDVLTILSQLRAEGEAVDKDNLFIVAGPKLKTPALLNGAAH